MKSEYSTNYPRPRNRYRKKAHSVAVAAVLAKHYKSLKLEFYSIKSIQFSAMDNEDIFHETMLYVIQDPIAFSMSETEILEHFRSRYKMIRFQIVQDAKYIMMRCQPLISLRSI